MMMEMMIDLDAGMELGEMEWKGLGEQGARKRW